LSEEEVVEVVVRYIELARYNRISIEALGKTSRGLRRIYRKLSFREKGLAAIGE
jgi:hypothetical protein